MMFHSKFLLPCTLVFNIPPKTLQTLELDADLLESNRLEKGNISKSHSNSDLHLTEKKLENK